MARFRLIAPHVLMTARGPALFEAGSEIESADQAPYWTPTAAMQAMDPEAEAMLKVECDRNRAECGSFGTIVGFGSTQTLPE